MKLRLFQRRSTKKNHWNESNLIKLEETNQSIEKKK
jgi:hypothetical protein